MVARMLGNEIRDVHETARLMIARYPDVALQIVRAVIADNQERGNDTRAKIWALAAAQIETGVLRPTSS